MGGGADLSFVDDSDDEALDRDQQILQAKCLPVSGPPLPPGEGPAQSADEYLRQVQWERLQCPELMHCDVEEEEEQAPRRRKRHGLIARDRSLISAFDAPEVPTALRHCPEWGEDAALAFRSLQKRCREMRREAIGPVGLGGSEGGARLDFEAWRDCCCKAGRPNTAMLASQDFVSINQLMVVAVDALVAACDALTGGDAATPGDQAASVSTAQGGVPAEAGADGESTGIDTVTFGDETDQGALGGAEERLDSLAEWAFAALAFLDEPLVDDVQYQLQRLRRACQRMCAGLGAAADLSAEPGAVLREGDAAAQVAGSTRLHIARVSLLLVLVTDVFGQR